MIDLEEKEDTRKGYIVAIIIVVAIVCIALCIWFFGVDMGLNRWTGDM
jgi:preprotein translocase subunit SecE